MLVRSVPGLSLQREKSSALSKSIESDQVGLDAWKPLCIEPHLSDAIFDNGPQDETHKASPSAPLRIEAFEGPVQRNIEEMQPLATDGSRSEAFK